MVFLLKTFSAHGKPFSLFLSRWIIEKPSGNVSLFQWANKKKPCTGNHLPEFLKKEKELSVYIKEEEEEKKKHKHIRINPNPFAYCYFFKPIMSFSHRTKYHSPELNCWANNQHRAIFIYATLGRSRTLWECELTTDNSRGKRQQRQLYNKKYIITEQQNIFSFAIQKTINYLFGISYLIIDLESEFDVFVLFHVNIQLSSEHKPSQYFMTNHSNYRSLMTHTVCVLHTAPHRTSTLV